MVGIREREMGSARTWEMERGGGNGQGLSRKGARRARVP